MKDWRRLEQTVISRIGYRTVVSKFFELPNGKISQWDTVNQEGWQAVVVLGLTEDNKVIVVRQYRPGPEMVMDELPGGLVDDGEDKEGAARREFAEETGYEVGELRFLGAMHYDGGANGDRNCFLATGCKPSKAGAQLGEHEFVDLKLFSIDELIASAKAGKMTDPGAVLLAYDELQKRRGTK